LQLRRNCPTCTSNIFKTNIILRIWPSRTTTYFLDWKTIETSIPLVWSRGHCFRGHHVWLTNYWISLWVPFKNQSNGLRSIVSFRGDMLNKSRVQSRQLVSFLFCLRTYQHTLV
jgi:hypothetical protein